MVDEAAQAVLQSDQERLVEFGPEIWTAEGSVVSFYGFPYPTRAAVIRLSDGTLFVWSPISLSPRLKSAIDALGPVRHLVSPNSIHHLFLGEWKAAYPDALLYAPPDLRKKCRGLVFHADLGDLPDAAWASDVDQVVMRGSVALTEVVFFHRASGSAIFGDLIQNFPRDWFRGWQGVVARLDGIVAPNPGAPREWRASFVRRARARAALERILSWPIERVLIAHGQCAHTGGLEFVKKAFGWLRPR